MNAKYLYNRLFLLYLCTLLNEKNMLKKGMRLVVLLGVALLGDQAFAQQDSQYTQYMYNTMMINPAYAGSRGATSIFALYRNQWVGLDGAPKTAALSFHTPFEEKHIGVGAAIYHESIGPQSTNIIEGDFAYTLDFEDSKLAFGLKAAAGFYNFDRDKLNLMYPADASFEGKANTFLPNIGAGVYYYGENYYVGFSIPHLLDTKTFSKTDERKITDINEKQHYNLMGGYVFDLSSDIKFKPAALMKMVSGSPLQVDLSGNFMYDERFVVGLAYRWSAAVSAMAGFQIDRNWFIGYAFDWETTKINKYNYGSHEIFLRYEFYRDIQKIISPRFF